MLEGYNERYRDSGHCVFKHSINFKDHIANYWQRYTSVTGRFLITVYTVCVRYREDGQI